MAPAPETRAQTDVAETDQYSQPHVPAAAAGAASTEEDSSKRRHSTPTCGTAHLSRLGADSPAEYDVQRCRRSGSAAPRRANRQTKDEAYRRTAALPAWAKAVRSSRGESSTSSQRRSSGNGASELGHNGGGGRLEPTTTATDAAARQEPLQQANFPPLDERLSRVDSMGSSAAGRSSGGGGGGIRGEAQFTSDTASSPPRVMAADQLSSAPLHQTAARQPPPQQRRSSIAFLPISPGTTGSSLFSPRSVGPATSATKDRINLGLGNASDFVASLIGTRGHDPAAEATEDNFWVPPTIWKKKRAQSLIPQKMSSETRILPGINTVFVYCGDTDHSQHHQLPKYFHCCDYQKICNTTIVKYRVAQKNVLNICMHYSLEQSK